MYIFINYLEERRVPSTADEAKERTDRAQASEPEAGEMQVDGSPIDKLRTDRRPASVGFQTVLCRKNVLLEVEQSDTIKKVKSRIEEQEGIPADQSILAYKRQVLDDDASIGDLKFIHNEVVIQLFLTKIKIFYQTLSGQLKPLKVKSMHTVVEVKAKIERREGIARQSFCLAYAGFELDDDRTLLNYGIHQCLTLQMNPRP